MLRHLLFSLVWHVDQTKAVEQPIDIRHTPDISQRLGSVHYLSDFTDIVIRQHHGAPRKTLAVLSAVDPQLLGEFISPALFQRICKGQAGHRLELVSPKSHHALPEVFLAGILPQRNHSSVVSLPLCPGTDIRRFSFLREVHAFLIRQIRGHRGTGQLQSRHGGGDGSGVVLCFSEGIKGLPDELCRVRLVDPCCDEQLPNLDRVEGQGVCDGLQGHFVRIKVSSRFHLLCQVLGCTVLWLRWLPPSAGLARVYYSLIFTLFLFPSQTIYCAQEYAVWTSGIQSTRRIALFRFFEDIIRCHSDIHRLYFTLHLLKSLRLLRLLRFQSIISLNGVALQPEAY